MRGGGGDTSSGDGGEEERDEGDRCAFEKHGEMVVDVSLDGR